MRIQHEFQHVISQIKANLRGVVGVLDEHDRIVACSVETRIGSIPDLSSLVLFPFETADGERFRAFSDPDQAMEGALLASVLGLLAEQQDEVDDKAALIQDIAAGKIAREMVYSRLKQLRIRNPLARVVVVFQNLSQRHDDFYNQVSNRLLAQYSGYIVHGNESGLMAVVDIPDGVGMADISQAAERIVTGLRKELGLTVVVGLSQVFRDLIDLPVYCKEAELALAAGLCQEPPTAVSVSGKTGLGGIVALMSKDECYAFLRDVNADAIQACLDEENMYTVQQFFANNLGVSETAKSLYINRNTLVYRLNKIEKQCGLDLRNFADASLLQMVIMVQNRLRWL